MQPSVVTTGAWDHRLPTVTSSSLRLSGREMSTFQCAVSSNQSVCRVEETRFSCPWGLGGSFGFPDAQLLTGLGTLLSSDDLADSKERVFRSLQWFRLAHTDGDNISELMKLVLQCTSFEILFALDENKGKTKQFIEAVKRRIASKNTILARRTDYRDRSSELLSSWLVGT